MSSWRGKSVIDILSTSFIAGMLFCTFYASIWYILITFLSDLLVNGYVSFVFIVIDKVGGFEQFAYFLSFLALLLGALSIGIQLIQKTSKSHKYKSWFLYLLPLAVFMIYSGLSVYWSVSPEMTQKRFWYFLVTTAIGLFVGFSFSERKILGAFSFFFVIVFLASVFAATLLDSGLQSNNYHGFSDYIAWRGIFDFKNTFGSVMSLGNILYLYLLMTHSHSRWWERVFHIVFYAMTLVMVYLSGSAASVVVVLLVTTVFLITLAYLKWGHLLKTAHWAGLGVIFSGTAISVWLAKRDILGLLGRNETLTFRVPTWKALFEMFIPKRPFLGYGGFGAFWKTDLKNALQAPVNWIPNHAHNGYIEMLLGLGVVGFTIFMVVFLENIFLGIKNLYRTRSNHAVWPILFFLHFSVVNLVYSLIGRIETFFWFVFVITLAYSIRVTFDPEQEADAGTAPFLE